MEKARELQKTEQKAIIRHYGGVLPLAVNVNGKAIHQKPAMSGNDFVKDVDIPVDLGTISGAVWNPTENNVSISVESSSGKIYEIDFPEVGSSSPMGLATETTVSWNAERQSISRDWFDGLKGLK